MDTTLLGLVLCPGENTVQYQGIAYQLGDVDYYTFTSVSGADSVVKVTVFQSPVLDFWATTTPICKGSNYGVIEFWDKVDITAPYEFSLDGGQTWYDEYTYTDLSAGYYKLRARNRVGCVFEYELTIPTYPALEVEAPTEVAGCSEKVPLNVKVNGPKLPLQYQWNGPNGELLSTDSIFQASQTGLFFLTVSNECDTIQRSIKVNIEEGSSDLQFYVPSSFTPNGDGINDCLQAYLLPSLQLLDFQFLVFDRWGGEVFRTKDIMGCWDGTSGSKAVNTSVFIWQASVSFLGCNGQTAEFLGKGELTILR